jgi:hypothetical protein
MSQFTQEGNLGLTLFDLGNNSDYAILRMIDYSQLTTLVPPLNIVDVMAGELITLAQILSKKMAIVFYHDDDEADEPNSFPLDYESDWLLPLERLVYFIHVQIFIKTSPSMLDFKLVMTIFVKTLKLKNV